MPREIINVPVLSQVALDNGAPLSMVTRGGGMVFVSGTPPLDIKTGEFVMGDISVQTRVSLTAMMHFLEAAGTNADNILMVRIYAANAGFYDQINAVYKTFFPDNQPARTFVPVAGWPKPFDIEIDCMALA